MCDPFGPPVGALELFSAPASRVDYTGGNPRRAADIGEPGEKRKLRTAMGQELIGLIRRASKAARLSSCTRTQDLGAAISWENGAG